MLRFFASTARVPVLRRIPVRAMSSNGAAPTFEHLEVEGKGNTLWITMARPKLHNAFNEHVIEELTQAFRNVDPSQYRSVVLTGQGASFSAGADMNWMKKMVNYSEKENAQDSLALFDMVHSIKACPVPVIGRVNGASLGGGSGLVAACDMSVALDSAVFGFTEVGLGLVPAVISPFVMEKLGKSNCSRYFLTGERFGAEEARRIGLITQHVDSVEALDAEVAKLSKRIDNASPAAVRQCKQLIERVSELSIEGSRNYVAGEIAKARVGEEGQDGLTAFLEKRKPKWLA